MKNLFKQSIYVLIFLVTINIATLAHAEISNQTLFELTNASRTQNDLSTLIVNDKLQTAARNKAQDMLDNQYFAHNSPAGKTPWDFITASGYNYVYAGENLAIGYHDNNELQTAWMNSPSHRENILNPNYREIGIASVSGTFKGQQTVIVTVEFGSVENTQPVVASASTSPTANDSVIIDGTNSSFSPNKIFSGDQIELNATLKKSVSDVYFTIGDKKYDIFDSQIVGSNNYSKKIAVTAKGDLPVTLTVVDSSGNRESKSLGTLTVASKVLVGGATNNDSSSNSPALFAVYIILGALVLGSVTFLIHKNRKSLKFA